MPLVTERSIFSPSSTSVIRKGGKRARFERVSAKDTVLNAWHHFNSQWLLVEYEVPCKMASDDKWSKHSILNNFFFERNCFTFANLFHTLFDTNREYDSVSWILAFIYADKISCVVKEGSKRSKFATAEFIATHSLHFIFTLYCISFKWHVDYSVSLDYLVDILPFSPDDRKVLLTGTICLEKSLLELLDFNCYVTESDLASFKIKWGLIS